MYISRLHIKNWRAYEDTVFEFRAPREGRPLVLIGAMNGHGKTSFLMALYVGIFGRHGLRYCEGLLTKADEPVPHYRAAIEALRRTHANPSDPTEIDITFSPGTYDQTGETVRILRRWHFTGANKPRQGSAFEEVEVYNGGRLQRGSRGVDNAADALRPKIESLLFPAHSAPAFFFDGEQSQKLVENAGGTGTRRALEILFGTKLLEETQELIRSQINRIHNAHGGRRATGALEEKYQEKVRERDELNTTLNHLQGKKTRLEASLDNLQEQRNRLMAGLTDQVDEPASEGSVALQALIEASAAAKAAERGLETQLPGLGLSMALAKYGGAIRQQLENEAKREDWENLSSSLHASHAKILRAVFPEPSTADELFGSLADDTVALIRQRVENALQSIQERPPDLIETILLGHITSDQRARQLHILGEQDSWVRDVVATLEAIEAAKRAESEAKQAIEDSKSLPAGNAQLVSQVQELFETIESEQRELGACEREIDKARADLSVLSADCGRLAEGLQHQEPGMELLGTATSLEALFAEVLEQLQPLAIQRIEAAVTEKFREIADSRFRNAIVQLSPEGPALLKNEQSNVVVEIARKSGYEKRAFGIGFALALAQVTELGLPMVIDTPLGNADSEYRPRTLNTLAKSGLDQIIILTHDKEVDTELASKFSRKTNQKFLIRYDRRNHRSEAEPGAYF